MGVFAPARAVRRAVTIAATALFAMTLAACSGGNPGPAEVKQAMLNNASFMTGMEFLAQAQASLTGDAPRTAAQLVQDGQVEVASCVAATNASGVVCDFRTGADGKFGGWTKARFFQANGQWQMEQME